MRILHIVGGLDRGGAETWLVQVLRHIDRAKYQFDFLVHTEKPSAYDDEVRSLGAEVIPCLTPSNPARYARNFLRILRKNGPYDCVHSHPHHFSGVTLTLAQLGGVRIRIAHSHLDSRVTETQTGVIRQLYLHVAGKLLYGSATAGLAVSTEAAASLFGEDWESDPRWRLLPLGIELDPFRVPVDGKMVRADLQIPPDAYVVGHVGRFSEQKNHIFLMEIARQACVMRPDAIFLLVGDGPLRRDMEARAKEFRIDHQLRFVGVRGDVPRLMKGAMDVFLFPSLYEGFGIVLLEAQAAGLRCVISDVITREVDTLPGLVQRVPLSESASTWARLLLNGEKKAESPDWEMMQPHGIDVTVMRLCSVYDSLMEQSR
jgi:glycosyltransferase involved in cell wall biosynthesis